MAALTAAQRDALRAAHALIDGLSAAAPGTPDTAERREARRRRTELEEAFGPDVFADPLPAARTRTRLRAR